MSDEQPAQPDDSEPTPERQAELRAAYEANVAAGKAPYDGVRIPTLGELRWVMQEHRWSGDDEPPEGYERANLSGANLESANLRGANLAGANLSGANLLSATLSRANLFSATLSGALLIDATLREASLAGATLRGADLWFSRMDAATNLQDARLDTYTRLGDVVWNGVPLTRLNWQDVAVLGDEHVARNPKDPNGKRKEQTTRLQDYADAVLANRQVATVLRSQGLNEHADRFAYRAQVLQRTVLRRHRRIGAYLFSLFLAALTGYGYRLGRIIIVYLAVILGFAVLFYGLGQGGLTHSHPDVGQAIVDSLAGFHERAFSGFLVGARLDPVRGWVTFAESVVGLVIESTFIAMLVQRLRAGSGG
jgi:Pentapeptide repeats (8 copies)